MSNKDSLTSITEKWLVEINHHCHDNPPCFLVGLKADLDASVSLSDVQSIQAANPQCQKIFTLSAKNDTAKVKELFTTAINAGSEQKKKVQAAEEAKSAGKAKASGGGGRRRGCVLL